jgi:predicted RNA binding protein YcfA (HicA-like mRNA interferase family)
MARLSPIDWNTLARIFEADGWTRESARGSHLQLVKPGTARPLVIPTYAEVPVFIISGLLKTAGMTRERFFSLASRI